MITRRKLLIVLGAGALPLGAWAQQIPKVWRIGFLSPGSAARHKNRLDALRAGLRDLGYTPGKNLLIESRYADGNYERLPDLAAELVALKVAVIIAAGSPAVRAAQKATKEIPIVMASVGNPVGAGLVSSLSRPGGNTTGLSNMYEQIDSKHLELLQILIPTLSRVALLWNPANENSAWGLKRHQENFAKTGVALVPVALQSAAQIDGIFAVMTRERVVALIIQADPFLNSHATRIAQGAIKNRVVTSFSSSEEVEGGGLMSYGPDGSEIYRRAATYVDKLLKGAKVSELPIEQPTKLELVINKKTAKALGITISQELLLRADKVIE